MNDFDDTDHRLRDLLTSEVDTQPTWEAREFLEPALVTGQKRLRRRRWAISLGAAAAVSAGALGVSLALDLEAETQREIPLAGAYQSPSTPFEWANSLKALDAPQLITAVDSRVRINGRDIATEADDVGLVGGIPGGAVVLLERRIEGRLGTRYAIVTTQGQVRELPQLAGATQNAVISPDFSSVAYSSHIVSLVDGSVVTDMPQEANILLGWNSEGIVYTHGDGKVSIWSPGSDPVEVDGRVGDGDPKSRFSVVAEGTCSTIQHVTNGRTAEVYRNCDPTHDLITVSPDGRYGITAELVSVDSATGETFPLAGEFSDFPIAQRPIAWSNNSTFSFVVSQDLEPYAPAVLVTCHLATRECTKLDAELTLGSDADYQISPTA